MADHIEIAKKFVQEQLQKRDDLVGALLVGSVAKGEETEFSDIDLRLIVERVQEDLAKRVGIDAWREGVYIDAFPVPRKIYTDIEKILEHPIRANDLNTGLILYDPTGVLAQTQKETQAKFMAPKWLAVRVKFLIEPLPQHIFDLQEAIGAKDHLKICFHTGRIVMGFALIPLIQNGIAPSSTRHMIQLGELSGASRNRILICTSKLTRALRLKTQEIQFGLFPTIRSLPS
ncbi:MAG: nucleotidyltransferase domain-containing protein [Candidatus Bipolaricaulia bacterium]